MSEFLSNLLIAVITAAVPVLTTYAVKLIKQVGASAAAKTDDAKKQGYANEIALAVSEAVSMVSQTYVDSLKNSGEFTKEAQKKAAAQKASGKKAAAPVKEKKKPQPKVVIRNTNTAMGKALAAAMGGMTLEGADTDRNTDGKAAKGGDKPDMTVSSLEKKIKDKKKLAEELGIGEITLTDILKELEKPARDPRDDMPAPILRSDVLDMKDLKPGMILKGTVRNVIDFGVFVDIGVHQDGLVHISQITNRYIKHPLEAVSVGDVVDVQVLTVDVAKKRIGLTMKIKQEA